MVANKLASRIAFLEAQHHEALKWADALEVTHKELIAERRRINQHYVKLRQREPHAHAVMNRFIENPS